MAQSPPLVMRLLASSVTVANRAGRIIRDVMRKGDLGIVEKGKNDLQTEADRSAQRCIIASLARQFPDVTVIGEEGPLNDSCPTPSDWIVTDADQTVLGHECPPEYASIVASDIVVWVDPLDGTSEYTQGFVEHVTVLIGLSVRGKAVGGVIHQPYYEMGSDGDAPGRTIWGLVGLGVGGFVPRQPPDGRLIVAVTRSHSDETVQAALEALRPDETVKVGGAGNKVLLLMEGKAHVYVFASSGCKKWDTCGPEAVLTAMGGRLTDLHGSSYSYDADVEHPNSRGVLATARGVNHSDILARIPGSVRSKFSGK